MSEYSNDIQQARLERRRAKYLPGCAFTLIVLFFLLSMYGVGSVPWPVDLFVVLLLGWIGAIGVYATSIPWGLAVFVATWMVALMSISQVRRWLIHVGQLSESDAPFPGKPFVISVLMMACLVCGLSTIVLTQKLASLVMNSERVFHGDNGYRRSQSKNLLKQLGISTHNFHDSDGKLSANRPVVKNGAVHSWVTPLLPYLENDPIYSKIDLTLPWDHPVNRKAFESPVYVLLNRNIGEVYDGDPSFEKNGDGYALNHYAANSRVIGFGKAKAFSDIKDGLPHTIFYGEVIENFEPWGRPGNSRDPALGIGHPMGFKGPWTANGCQFTFGDGRVEFISSGIDPKVLEAISTPSGGDDPGEF